MKKNIHSTPIELQKVHFRTFIQSLTQKFEPLQLFSFSCSIVNNETTSCFNKTQSEYCCHYYLLMVTESSNRIGHEVQSFANENYEYGTITILSHGKKSLLEAVQANNRFFITVLEKGQLIYSMGGMIDLDFNVSYIPTQAGVRARENLEPRIQLADGFLKGATECLKAQNYNVCAFMLHQVVEQCFNAFILVFLGYRSNIYNLHRMLRLCGCFSKEPKACFLSGTSEDERLFKVLVRSYSSTRYEDGFLVNRNDAAQLFEKVSVFFYLTKRMCEGEIIKLEKDALLFKEARRKMEVVNG
ncbi:HEPN domain-containing protein [Pedobacter sp. PAMC26386]|nr:HEPN domain-containing protein [Pedobacter sp. PAMC26386]